MRKKSLNDQQKSGSLKQMVYQRGNQREGSPYYVFLYSDDENSEDEETIALKPRQSTASTPRRIEVINVVLKPEDTLQALALRYRCTISELKRINKIHKENEIFARRSIKIPVQPYSLLTETVDQIPDEHTDSLDGIVANTSGATTVKVEQLVNLTSAPAVIESPKAEINAIILNSVCEPLSSFNNVNPCELCYTESDELLVSTENKAESHVTDTFKCSGDDCGLSWAQLLGFSLLLGFAGPIIYILYIAEFSSKNHSETNH